VRFSPKQAVVLFWTKAQERASHSFCFYNDNGNVTQIVENATLTTNYQYDALNRLTAIERSTGESVNYQYDTRGNRIQTAGITLDETDFIPGEFTYSNWEELTSFAIDGGDTYTYQYDAEGLRTYKTGPSSTTKYHYDLSGRVIAESNGAGNVTAQNIWGHKMLARKIGAAYYYYLYNGHGDVVQIVNESGAIVNSYTYDEWGNIRTISETVSNPLRYCGEYFDEESGLYYLRARYYDPLIARFITKDSLEGDISNPLSMNQYTYCYNNPLIYADTSGHYTQLDFSNWTGTAAQAAQLQALFTNHEAYKSGDISADTASDNYSIIMDNYAASTSNGYYHNEEGITAHTTPKNSSNADAVTSIAETKSAAQEDARAEAQVMPTGTSQGSGGKSGILNAALDFVSSKEVSAAVSTAGGVVATVAFVGAAVGLSPFIVGAASTASMILAAVGVLQSSTRIIRGDSSLYEEGLNMCVNTLSFAGGLGSIGFNSFKAVTNQNVGKALSFIYSRTLSVFSGVTGLGELISK